MEYTPGSVGLTPRPSRRHTHFPSDLQHIVKYRSVRRRLYHRTPFQLT